MSDLEKKANSRRFVLLIVLLTAWSLIIHGRLLQLQVFQHREYLQKARNQQEKSRWTAAARGSIYDRHRDELAASATVHSVVVAPGELRDLPTAALQLASLLELEPQGLLREMADPANKNYLKLKDRIDPGLEPQIEALDIRGVHLVEESIRAYPNRTLASHTLGFLNFNGDGVTGLERQYSDELGGTRGHTTLGVDAHRRSFRAKVDLLPDQGESLVLSLDRSIQYIAERELAVGVQKAKAAAGVAVVMESETGRILALANYPGFNCNTYQEYPAELWRNRAVQDLFEPGSTLKVVTVSAALEAGLVAPGELFDCQGGKMVIGDRVVHCSHPHGRLTVAGILEQSCNIGAAKLGLRLGKQRLYEKLCDFGIGARTGVDLPFERIGRMSDWTRWSPHRVAVISFGQGIVVTSMQILMAINVIASGGFRVRPSVAEFIIDADGDTKPVRAPERFRILRPEVVARVMNALEGAVLRGTGKRAGLEGYRAAGKTGTAQRVEDGQFSKTKHVSSFIGFAPLPQPRVTVLVQIRDAQGSDYGGEIAAPVFKQITQQTLFRLGVPLDQGVHRQPAAATVATFQRHPAQDQVPKGVVSSTTLARVNLPALSRIGRSTKDQRAQAPASPNSP